MLVRSSLLVVSTVSVLSLLSSAASSAMPVPAFQQDTLLSDQVLSNSLSMTKNDIQTFLNEHGQNCQSTLCLKNYTENSKQASQIIYDTSIANNLNPQIFIALLEAENNLITTDSPQQNIINSAFGFSCITVQGNCTTTFTDQINQAAAFLKNPINATYKVNQTVTLPYKAGDTSCSDTTFIIANTATALIYSYPGFASVPDSTALSVGMDQGGACSSYAVRNFYISLNQWFGSMNIYDYSPMYRFWSNTYKGHFYTSSETEKNSIINTMSNAWTLEGVAYQIPTYKESMCRGLPYLYRFWSNTYKGHFYTSSETEKNSIINTMSNAWTFEGVAYYSK